MTAALAYIVGALLFAAGGLAFLIGGLRYQSSRQLCEPIEPSDYLRPGDLCSRCPQFWPVKVDIDGTVWSREFCPGLLDEFSNRLGCEADDPREDMTPKAATALIEAARAMVQQQTERST